MERQHQVSLKFKHIKIQVISGIFYQEQTDVVVNSTSQILRLSDGMGSHALLEAAGNQIQHEVSALYPDGVRPGEIAVSGGYKLYCSLVYHCNLKKWTDNDQEEAEKVLKEIISLSLEKANKSRDIHSITFPALGRGFNRFKAKPLAHLMFQCVADFDENLRDEPFVTDVRFVIYPGDEEAIEAFIEEAKQRCQEVFTTMEYTTDIGDVHIFLQQGTMTKQKCDIVVNEASENMDLSKLPITISAGPDLEQSLRRNVASDILGYGVIVVTGNGNLNNCISVYHGALCPFTKQTKDKCKQAINIFVRDCLMEATGSGLMSIAFPPLGIDLKNYPPELSAEAIQGSIIEYLSTNMDNTTIQKIYIIVPSAATETFKVFKDIMFPNVKGKEKLDRTLIAKSPFEAQNTTQIPLALNLVQIPPKPVKRGTKQWYVKKYEEPLRTPSYWKYFTGNQRIRKLKVAPEFKSKKLFRLEDVDTKILQAIRSVVEKTWDSESFSHGRDAVGLGDLNYNMIKVTDVKRLENLTLFERYASFRQQMFGKVLAKSKKFHEPERLRNSKGPLLTTSRIDPCLTNDIYKEINEHYVFHGTKQENVEIILATGLDSRMAGPHAMFGQGVYAAESSTKADQYTDYRDKRDTKEKSMFLTRMCMGDICKVDKPIQMKRPPCKSCLKTVCKKECRNTDLFDSVLVDGQWIFREMIVYDHAQCYPEYLITYRLCFMFSV